MLRYQRGIHTSLTVSSFSRSKYIPSSSSSLFASSASSSVSTSASSTEIRQSSSIIYRTINYQPYRSISSGHKAYVFMVDMGGLLVHL